MDQEPTRLGVHDVDLADWRWLLATLRADFAVGSLGEGAEFVRHLTGLVDEQQTRADVRLTADRVVVSLQGAASATVTERESALAEKISVVAAGRGLVAAPQRLQLLELALDTPADAAVRPFWAAVLGAEVDGDDVVDPAGVLPPLWFQDTDSTAPDRQRFHLDITVPPEVAEERIAAAVDAGGTVVDHNYEPAFTVLADADSNRVCICTALGRD